MSKKHIGRTDKFDFLDFSIENIDVKMDTGAYTSSIRCLNVEEKTINGKRIIEFKLLDESHPEYADKVFQTSNSFAFK